MSLADGGHLTHGAAVNFQAGYNAVQYGINHGELIDYDAIAALARGIGPR